MDAVTNTLSMWQSEGIIVVALFFGAIVFYHATKVWSSPADLMLAVLLGASVGISCVAIYFLHRLGFGLKTKEICFIALYIWCALGLVFFAGKNTHGFKIFLGLVSQAGILYALFILV